MAPKEDSKLRTEIISAIKEIYDPELPVNIYDLGLIYEVNLLPKRKVHIVMTLTTPSCPVADSLPKEVAFKVRNLPEVEDVEVELTFDPPYTIELLSEEAKLALGIL